MMCLRIPWMFLLFPLAVSAADLPDSHDPAGMKRYESSEIIGYRAPKFDAFLVPLGVQTSFAPVMYEKSVKAEGLVSRYTYLAPAGRTTTEIVRNYRQEFTRLGLTVVYAKAAGERGWFGPTFDRIAEEEGLGQILAYNEAQEQVLVAKSKDVKPAYYYLFVTAYKDGIIPERLAASVTAGRALAELIVIQPEQLTQKMVFVNAEEMASALKGAGRVALYGIYFDTDKDVPRADSQPTVAEIAKLLTANPSLKIRVVGHTDNTGGQEHNLDLSRRRAAAVVQALVSQYKIAAGRLDSFGAGSYAPVASNADDEGRSKNRRVELVEW
jgi:OmpA-OmpF porin, OOP family